jgi:hypothetical protein
MIHTIGMPLLMIFWDYTSHDNGIREWNTTMICLSYVGESIHGYTNMHTQKLCSLFSYSAINSFRYYTPIDKYSQMTLWLCLNDILWSIRFLVIHFSEDQILQRGFVQQHKNVTVKQHVLLQHPSGYNSKSVISVLRSSARRDTLRPQYIQMRKLECSYRHLVAHCGNTNYFTKHQSFQDWQISTFW